MANNMRFVEYMKAGKFVKYYAAVSRYNFTKEEREVNTTGQKILSTSSVDDTKACWNFTMADLNKVFKMMNKKGATGVDDTPSFSQSSVTRHRSSFLIS